MRSESSYSRPLVLSVSLYSLRFPYPLLLINRAPSARTTSGFPIFHQQQKTGDIRLKVNV